jgi:hypothetical protein
MRQRLSLPPPAGAHPYSQATRASFHRLRPLLRTTPEGPSPLFTAGKRRPLEPRTISPRISLPPSHLLALEPAPIFPLSPICSDRKPPRAPFITRLISRAIRPLEAPHRSPLDLAMPLVLAATGIHRRERWIWSRPCRHLLLSVSATASHFPL